MTFRAAQVDVLAELRDFGQAYRVFVGVDRAETMALRKSYQRIDALGITTALPLLLWLRTLPPERLSVAEHERAVGAVESWIVRRLLVGANTRGYGKAFVDVLRSAVVAADAAEESISDAVVRVLDRNLDRLSWPSDADLISAFVTRKAYGLITQERIRLVLGAIDEYLQQTNPKTEPARFRYNELQIEHVMPQSWRDHWPLCAQSEVERLEEARRRDEVVHVLGNLTLVTSSFNQSASNSAWGLKRPLFQVESKLQLNSAIASHEEWNVEKINERGVMLAELAARVWPRPAST